MRSKQLFLGFGFTFGFFAPPDVNDYIEGWQDSLGLTLSQTGFTPMVLNMVPRFVVTSKPMPYLELQAIGRACGSCWASSSTRARR